MGDISKWLPLLKGIVDEVWDKYGPFAVVLLLFVAYHEIRVYQLWTARLADKDLEIQRLVDARNRLEDAVLAKRISSGEKTDA